MIYADAPVFHVLLWADGFIIQNLYCPNHGNWENCFLNCEVNEFHFFKTLYAKGHHDFVISSCYEFRMHKKVYDFFENLRRVVDDETEQNCTQYWNQMGTTGYI